MGRRSPETMIKRAREQALREKREMKQAKKDARAAEKLRVSEEGETGDGTPEDETPEDDTSDAATVSDTS